MTEQQHQFIFRLYQEHSPRMIQYAARKTGDRDQAEDLVQEAFLIACIKILEVEDHAKPVGWLYSTLNNHLKRVNRHPTLSLDQLHENALTAELSTPLELLMPRELSDTARKIVMLRVGEERSYTEIAEEMGMSEAACRKQMSRAIKLFQKNLEK